MDCGHNNLHLSVKFEVVESQFELGVATAILVGPLLDGQQTALLEPSGSVFGGRERMLGVCARHQHSKLLEVRGQELAEEVGPRKELTCKLEGGEAYFSMFLGKIMEDDVVGCSYVGVILSERTYTPL